MQGIEAFWGLGNNYKNLKILLECNYYSIISVIHYETRFLCVDLNLYSMPQI